MPNHRLRSLYRRRGTGAVNLVLHGHWRSSAAYRVRIALNLKGLDFAQVPHDLRGGEQHAPAYVAIAPQARVPSLETDAGVLTQSLAIIEWLDEAHPLPPLLPADPTDRAVVRAMAQLVACDIHPLNNLSVLQWLRKELGANKDEVTRWTAQWITQGFAALEVMISRHGGVFAFGDAPTLADCCLVPQLYSARRFGVDLREFPRTVAAGDACAALPACVAADPAAQPDADVTH